VSNRAVFILSALVRESVGSISFIGLALLLGGLAIGAPAGDRAVEWPFYSGDQAATNYSPLTQINEQNVSHLRVAWTWKTDETNLKQFGTRPGAFENTPLMIDNVLYVITPYNQVVALSPETGMQLWKFDPKSYVEGQPTNGMGFTHRGIAAWRNGKLLRLFLNTRYRLICLDAKTGRPVDTFGQNGTVDLSQGLIWPIKKLDYTQTSPPVVYGNLVILGSVIGDRLVYHNDPPGEVRAFDVHTGRQVWSFHTIPQRGEFGNETWGENSWKFTGHTNVWAPMSIDVQRGLLFLPVSTPSNDFFGGHRPGNNIFAESIVCLDAATGIRKWHYQLIHHGLWDYDLPAAPILVTLSIDGRKVDVAVQLTKQGFAFVFERTIGQPVWPIEERPVPASDVDGEHASLTQPFPSFSPAFTPQGVTLDDAFDATPELKAAAQAELRKYRLGPMFTPPSYRGTVMRPGIIGGANWGGGAFDPETGLLYVHTTNLPHLARIVRPDSSSANPRANEVDADWSGDVLDMDAAFSNGIPLTKPPYAQLTALNLNKGAIVWSETFGDWAELRQNPALKNVPLPAKLGIPGNAGMIVTKAGLIFIGSEDTALHAIDKATGKDLWQGALPGPGKGTPMTYQTSEGRQFVVVATGSGENASLVAFALESPPA
jgi:quinoprotein glucose dehydrogenase